VSLITPHLHRNPTSAALLVAANRASESELLRDGDAADLAERNAERLELDVRDWIKNTAAGRRSDEQTRRLLYASVARAYRLPDEWLDYARQYGFAEARERARLGRSVD
jgi:hypothetical protein